MMTYLIERSCYIVGGSVICLATLCGLFYLAWWILDLTWWRRIGDLRKAAYIAAFGDRAADDLVNLRRLVFLEYAQVGGGNQEYWIAHVVAAISDAPDTGDWKGEVLHRVSDAADRLGVSTFTTNDMRTFVRDDSGPAGTYGWVEQ